MRTYAQRPQLLPNATPAMPMIPRLSFFEYDRERDAVLYPWATGNRFTERPETKPWDAKDTPIASRPSRFAYDFSRLPVRPGPSATASHGDHAVPPDILPIRGLEERKGARTDSNAGSASNHDMKGVVRGPGKGSVKNAILEATGVNVSYPGDILRPVGTHLENALIGGNKKGVKLRSGTVLKPTWKKTGAFEWHVRFSVDAGSGWIVQEIINSSQAQNEGGKAMSLPACPHFWEAWDVNGGKVTPLIDGCNDAWDQVDPKLYFGAVKGHWATLAKLYFTKKNPAAQGFKRHNPAVSKKSPLLTSTTAPSGLGAPRLYRYAQGTWDATGAHPHHAGSAGPVNQVSILPEDVRG